MAEPNLPETGSTQAPPTAAAPPAPPPPPKPAAPAKPAAAAKKAEEPTRRNVLVSGGLAAFLALFGSWFAVAWTTFTLSVLGLVLGVVRFMFPNVLTEPPSSFKAGDWTNFEDNKVDDKFKEVGAWIIRGKDDSGRDIIYALSTTCTHLGCTPNWLESEKKFKCPCHGSGFKITGVTSKVPRHVHWNAMRSGVVKTARYWLTSLASFKRKSASGMTRIRMYLSSANQQRL